MRGEIRMMQALASLAAECADQPAGAADTARGSTREQLMRKYGFSR